MNPTILGVIGPGFLNQVPTLPSMLLQKVPRFSAAVAVALFRIILLFVRSSAYQ